MLTRLKLRDFRCFPTLELTAAPGAQFIVGDNAQGKTSILEAVAVLLRLASPRSASLGPLVRFGAASFSVQGRYGDAEMQFRYSSEGRRLVLDGEPQAGPAEYLRVARLVYFGNSDVELVRGSSEVRRRYLDFLGGQIEPLVSGQFARVRTGAAFAQSAAEGDAGAPSRGGGVRRAAAGIRRAASDLRRNLMAELAPLASRAQGAIRGAGDEAEALSLDYQPGGGADFPSRWQGRSRMKLGCGKRWLARIATI